MRNICIGFACPLPEPCVLGTLDSATLKYRQELDKERMEKVAAVVRLQLTQCPNSVFIPPARAR